MMAEYIEREKAFKLIKEQKEKETGAYSKGRNTGLFIAGSIINNKEVLPTADVVEVVRCKECKHFTAGYCCRDIKGRSQMHYMGEEAFCSYGERSDI